MNYKLTKLLFLSAIVGTSLHASGQYTCMAKDFRSNGGTMGTKAESRFVLTLQDQADGSVKAEAITGHVTLVGYDNHVAEKPADNYYSVFALKNLTNNPNFNPHVYHNHVQFKEVNAVASSNVDGGGMFGALVVNKTRPDNANFDAHYVFQSGDHMGGTIDYDCTE